MNVTIEFPREQIPRWVQHVYRDQLPFATARAINDAANAGQKAQRAHQRDVFTVRRPAFVDRAVKIKPFATKRSLEARVWIDPPGGQARADILTQHETDATKRPIEGRSIAVPTENVRVTKAGVIRRGDRPRALRERGTRSSGSSGRGKYGGGVFLWERGRRRAIAERTSRGSLRILYWLVPSVDLDQRLQFVETVSAAALRAYPAAFVTRFDQAIRSAR